MRRILAPAATAALLAPAALAAAAAPAAITLRASGPDAGGAAQHVREGLYQLDRDDFDVVRRSDVSVTLGYPKLKPRAKRRPADPRRHCARITYRLSVVPESDPVARVRALVPQALAEGVSAQTDAPSSRPGDAPDAVRAWRHTSSIVRDSLLHVRGAAATRNRPGDGFLSQLTLEARMVRTGGPCGGTNTFTVGPRVLNVLRG